MPLQLAAVHSSVCFSRFAASVIWSEWRSEPEAAVRADARGLTKSEIAGEQLNGTDRAGFLVSNGGAISGGECCLYQSGGSCQYPREQIKKQFCREEAIRRRCVLVEHEASP
jgi:hypothetical protein